MSPATFEYVDGADMEWVNGDRAAASMAPEFREHLGPAQAVRRMLQSYWVRPLLVDARSTRRIDHVRCDPGYVDATCAFHRSVEECLVIGGSLHLLGEGELRAGDYFWRPAGFVHSAKSPEGFECLLMMEGESISEASGPVTREIRDPDIAGTNELHPDDWPAAIGPRGWPRRVTTSFLAAGPAPREMFASGSTARCLSFNPWTGAGSYLVNVPEANGLAPSRTAADPRRTEPPTGRDRERIVVVLRGTIQVGELSLGPFSLVRLAVSVPTPSITSLGGAELLFKVA